MEVSIESTNNSNSNYDMHNNDLDVISSNFMYSDWQWCSWVPDYIAFLIAGQKQVHRNHTCINFL